MQYNITVARSPIDQNTECLIVATYTDGKLSKAAKIIDDASDGAISERLGFGDYKSELGQLEILYRLPNIGAQRVMLVGCGNQEEFNLRQLKKVANGVAANLGKTNIKNVVSYLIEELSDSQRTTEALQQCVLNQAEAHYTFDQFKSKKADEISLESITYATTEPTDKDLKATLNQAIAISNGTRLTKDLANSPGNFCTPTHLADTATEIANQSDKTSIEVLEEADMEKLGMGAFLSVSKGSAEPGKMIILHYQGGEKSASPIALVGKGITFDTGGISLKPGAAMDEMKYDMGGAASVLGAFKACVEMELPLNLVCIVAAAENMPGNDATKPGDIVTTMSGQTVEILNTDAEGRLVLCDALTYVEKFDPAAVIDVATLTGACIIALGHHISGLMSNNDSFANEIIRAGHDIQDPVWQLPMTDDYQEQLKSNFADIPNIGAGRAAGTITAACYLSRFTEKYTWAHLDIAGTAWKSGAAKGATGRPVPLLTQFLINRTKA